jgi:fibro-slime domain-containing protein
MWDINPERYNAMMRGIYPEEYYPINIPDREKIDKKYMLFGSTEGMCVGGIQNGFVGPNINRTCSGILQNLANKKLVNGNLVINSEYTNGSSFFPSGSVRNDVYVDVIQDWKFPFLKESNGYYSFNSDSLHVKRDYASKKFTLHKGSRNGFYPFNNCEDNTFEKTNKNLYFTAKFEIPFYMNKDGKIKNSLTGQLEDMKFNFSGDDDVWIYVDDDLAVDLGGLHCKQTGNINFAKKQVI